MRRQISGIYKNWIYSFEGDFNDVCATADAELLAQGFKIDHKASLASSVRRDYFLGNRNSTIYHVLNRGNGRQEFFHKKADYRSFVELMKEGKERYSVKI